MEVLFLGINLCRIKMQICNNTTFFIKHVKISNKFMGIQWTLTLSTKMLTLCMYMERDKVF